MGNIIDSGERREFSSGAVRDIQEGKGRCDLLPLETICNVEDDAFLMYVEFGIRHHAVSLLEAIRIFTRDYFSDEYTALLELSKHYEDGCNKYGERNWEKGIPVHCFIDSAIRHYLKFRRGDTDERHDRAVLWNLYGAMWTIIHHPELNDLPYNQKEQE